MPGIEDMIMRRKLHIIFERPNPFAVSRSRSNPSLLMGDDAWNMIHVRQHNVALLLHPLCVLPRVPYSDQFNLVSHRNTLLEIETTNRTCDAVTVISADRIVSDLT